MARAAGRVTCRPKGELAVLYPARRCNILRRSVSFMPQGDTRSPVGPSVQCQLRNRLNFFPERPTVNLPDQTPALLRSDTLEAMRAGDQGFFGPESVSWRVHRETTVLFGGARALLMQAAHPLVIAGARETGFYERNPWKRLERTLQLTYAITFGSRSQAQEAAARINTVHR